MNTIDSVLKMITSFSRLFCGIPTLLRKLQKHFLGGILFKNLFLRILKSPQGSTTCRIFFSNICNLIKKRLRHRYFLENFEKRLRTIFHRTLLDDYLWCLLSYFNFDFINTLLVYRLIKWYLFGSQKFYNVLKKLPFASLFYNTLLLYSFSFFITTAIF